MVTPERVSESHDESRYEESDRHEQEEQSRRPATRKKVRRWEAGVFIRKIVNGWLAYYKKFPPGPESEFHALEHQETAGDSGTERGQRSLVSGPVRPLSGHGQGNTDTGPVGQARLEAGVFLESTTETSDAGSDEIDNGS